MFFKLFCKLRCRRGAQALLGEHRTRLHALVREAETDASVDVTASAPPPAVASCSDERTSPGRAGSAAPVRGRRPGFIDLW